MTAFRDLAPCTYFGNTATHILAVGWLGRSVPFATGPTPRDVFERLKHFAKRPWQPFVAMGVHACELCQFEGEQAGGANLFIPFQQNIYVAPALIAHYINAHCYAPPAEFCEAVLQCPAMDSMDYKQLLIACNYKALLPKLASGLPL